MKNLRDDQQVVEIDRLRGHRIQPDSLDGVPDLYATDDIEPIDKTIHLHYFTGNCDWWIAEVDPDPKGALMFGFVCLGDPAMAEWGYVDLEELALVRAPGPRVGVVQSSELGDDWRPVKHLGQLPIVVERDLHWKPKPFSEIDAAMAILFAKGMER